MRQKLAVIHRSLMHSIISAILNILFPVSCIGCRTQGLRFCASCLECLPLATKPEDAWSHAVFAYQTNAMREAIWRFKYHNARDLGELFAPALADAIIETFEDGLYVSRQEQYLLVPIPLHERRLKERGYNQSELLARAVTHHIELPNLRLAADILVRTRATKPQARNDTRPERLKNMRNAFAVTPRISLKGSVVILIDDVTTTGATIAEARKTLLAAGARDVIAFALAH